MQKDATKKLLVLKDLKESCEVKAMAAYTIDFKASVEKDLRKVPKDRLPDILEKIEELAEIPLPPDSKKLSGAEHLYRIRVGDYRIIYEVVHKTKSVTIFYIRNRRSAYRRL